MSAVLYPASEALVASDEAEAQKSGTRLNGSFTLGERIFLDSDEYSACANRLEAMGYGMSRLLTSAHNQWRQAFTYDANGNRLTKTTSWGTIVYEYDGENRLLGAGTLRYAYDADGNLLSETSPYGTKTYRYSGSNRKKESRVTDLEAKTEVLTSYAYDAFGRRTLVADDGGDTMRTMYDGLSFEVFHEGVAYADSSFASASSRSVQGAATGSTNGRYVYIDDEADGRSSFVSNDSVRRIAVRYTGESSPLYAGGARVAVNRSGNDTTRGGRAYFGTDILGSVRSASGDNSVLEDRYEYDAFGVPYEGDFSSGTGAGYTGKPYDPITGLANYGYRDNSPVTARFTTVDPIRDGSNWFAYVNNDPVNYVDEWGLSASDKEIDLVEESLEVVNSVRIGFTDEASLNIPGVVSVTLSGDLGSVGGNFDSSTIEQSISIGLTLGSITIVDVSVSKTVEQKGGQTAFDLLYQDVEVETTTVATDDITITLPIPYVAVEINITETIDLVKKLFSVVF